MKYINRKCFYTKQIETVDEFDLRGASYLELRQLVNEYRLADRAGHYYISQRATKDWYQK